MRPLFLAAWLAVYCFDCFAQTAPVPGDIDPKSHSRLPLIQREKLSVESRQVYDFVAGAGVPSAPGEISLYSPSLAEPIATLNRRLRNAMLGPQMFEICALVAAREFDDNFEWAGHEDTARNVKVDGKTIEAIKFDQEVEGLAARDALMIRFGRALFRKHRVSSALYSEVVKTFGQQGMVEASVILGDYAMAAVMLRAVDQRRSDNAAPLPPIPR